MAKQSEVLGADEFRDRTRKEYEDRRAEGKLRHARTTCVNLDAKADIKVTVGRRTETETHFLTCLLQFNRLWLDPGDLDSFPPGLSQALEEFYSSSSSAIPVAGSPGTIKPGPQVPDAGAAARLKAQMQADALRPLDAGSVGDEGDEEDERRIRMGSGVDLGREDHDGTVAVWPEETLLQVGDYLRLNVSGTLRSPLQILPCLVTPFPCPSDCCVVNTRTTRAAPVHPDESFYPKLTSLIKPRRHNDWSRC